MKTYSVVFTPEAEEQLTELYRYIAENASPEIALHYTNAVVEHCESLGTLPHRGTPRDDIRPGLRTTPYKRRTVIAYTVESDQVSIIGVFHGGRITNLNCSRILIRTTRALSRSNNLLPFCYQMQPNSAELAGRGCEN